MRVESCLADAAWLIGAAFNSRPLLTMSAAESEDFIIFISLP